MNPTETKIAAAKTLQEADELLKRLGIKETVEKMVKNPAEERLINGGIKVVHEHLKSYVNVTPEGLKKYATEYLENFEKKLSTTKKDMESNLKRILSREFSDIMFLFEDPQNPEAKELLNKRLSSVAGEKHILGILRCMIEELDAKVFSDYITVVYLNPKAGPSIVKDFEDFIRSASDTISKNVIDEIPVDDTKNVIPLFTAKSPFSESDATQSE